VTHWLLGLGLLSACAPAATPLGATHPANPRAPTGRLAGPPPALRKGVAESPEPAEPAPAPAPAHDHGGHGDH